MSSEGLVSSTRRSSSSLKRLPTNHSSSLIGLFSELSSHTRVVLLGLASCRALPRLLGQQTEHLAQRLGLVLDLPALWSTALSDSFTSCCPRPRGFVPSSVLCLPALHGPESSWDCRRVLHKTPPNELDRHDPSGRGLHSSRCTRRNCEVLHIVQQRFSEASTGSAETNSNVFSQTLYVVSLLRNCFFVSNSAVSLLRFLLTCCEQASKLQSAVSHLRHG